MKEDKLINMANNEELGKIEISPEVLEVIAGIATSEVESVASLRGTFASDVAKRLGRKQQHGKGVKVEIKEDSIKVDIFVIIHYGAQIIEVCKKVQENVHQSIKTMTALDLDEVNVHVVGIQLEVASKQEKEQE